MSAVAASHHGVVVIGGGQAGLAVSYHLTARGIGHVVFEKESPGHAWRSQRWDSFCLVTPNQQCRLPGFPYRGDDPHGFMGRDEIVAYVEDYARAIAAPLSCGVAVERLSRRPDGGFLAETADGAVTADAVVMAVGGYHRPKIPPYAARLPESILQLHSSHYRNPGQLPPGEVLVVGSGQSGGQIAEDLHLAGRRVHLAVGGAPRCPRFYRGRDAVDWLADLGQYDLPVDQHPAGEAVRRKANHTLTGRDGGRDIDFRRLATEGMRLYGRLDDIRQGRLWFRDDLGRNLDAADTVYNGICQLIDKHIAEQGIAAPAGHRYQPPWHPVDPPDRLDPLAAGISAVIWCTGFGTDYAWVDLPAFDGAGYPVHRRGVTAVDGLYVVGLPWLYTWGSGRFVGVGRDAEYIVEHIVRRADGAPGRK